MRIRIRFTKQGKVRFISHRDMARVWERAIRRIELPVAYSQGFSPRPKVHFGLALPTGAESWCEYLDVDLRDSSPDGEAALDPSSLIERLAPVLPVGMAATAVSRIDTSTTSLQEAVTSSTWRIVVAGAGLSDLNEAVERLLAADELITTRQRKGHPVTDDIRPYIVELEVAGPTQDGIELVAELGTRPRGLRPSELIEALGDRFHEVRICRTHQWMQLDGARQEPLPERAPRAPRHRSARHEKGSSQCPIPTTSSAKFAPPATSAPAGTDPAGGNPAEKTEPNAKASGTRGAQARAGSAGTAGRARSANGSGRAKADDRMPDDLPDRHRENMPSAEAAAKAVVRRPQIGDSLPAPSTPAPAATSPKSGEAASNGEGTGAPRRKRRRGGRDGGAGAGTGGAGRANAATGAAGPQGRAPSGGGGRPRAAKPVELETDLTPLELDDEVLEQRRGRERNGRAVGRYLMAVHVGPPHAEGGRGVTQIAVLEGRSLLEHYVSHPADDISQIHGNVYLAKVQNVLPGMEAAFVDIGTPKNAVLYRGDTRYDAEDIEEKGTNPRIEQILRARQNILCQVTKNPIAHKGARLTQEVSMPGRFVVLIPNSTTYGISKRLPDNERKRLRSILDKVKPKAHGLIVRTAAENITAEEIERDVLRLARQWEQIEALAAKSPAPALLYREPDMAVRVIREEFNKEYRKVVIDDLAMYEEVRDYVRSISPALEDRVEFYDPATEPLPLLEKFHVHEQLHKALDRKVWLPSGGSLIIEHTEALTVIDVNTGKNVGTSSLEETVYRNNLEAATEIARQLRLRDIGGIIVIDFIDMEVKANREDVIRTFRDALARDKTRTQVFDISELGLVEMTRKRIGEGLLESFSSRCAECEGRGVLIDRELLGGEPGQ